MNYYINKEIANLQIQDEQAKLYILGSNPSNFKLKTGYLHSHTSSKTLDWHSNYSILSEIIARTLRWHVNPIVLRNTRNFGGKTPIF